MTDIGQNASVVSPYSGRPVTHAPNWEGLTAWDIWLNNLSVGIFLAAMTGVLVAPAEFGVLACYALPLAFVIILSDQLLLISDLGDPTRFHHMLRLFKRWATMSFGTWSLVCYVGLLGVAAVAFLPEWPLFMGVRGVLGEMEIRGAVELVGVVAAMVAIPAAFGSILYKGVLFSTTSQPGWRDARWLGAYVANSAVLLGAALLMPMAALTGQIGALALLRSALPGLLVLDMMLLCLVYRALAPVCRERYGVDRVRRFGTALVTLGSIAPFLLLLLPGGVPAFVLPLLILPTALAARYALVRLPAVREGVEQWK